MSIDVSMPKLGVEMTSGKILEWKIKQGEWVEREKPLVVIETSKVSYEMASPGSGYLNIIVLWDKKRRSARIWQCPLSLIKN